MNVNDADAALTAGDYKMTYGRQLRVHCRANKADRIGNKINPGIQYERDISLDGT